MTQDKKQGFNQYARQPEIWVLAARRSMLVYVLLSREREKIYRENTPFEQHLGAYFSISYFHAGIALENAIKAVLIYKNPEKYIDGKVRFKSHSLVKLAKKVIDDLTDEELTILSKLEKFVVWAGKYTAPLSPDDLYDQDIKTTIRTSQADEDLVIRGLYDRILSMVI